MEGIRKFFGLSDKARRWLPLIMGIFVGAFLIRIITLGIFLEYDPGFTYDDDSDGYVTLAENLLLGNGFSLEKEDPYHPDSFRTPGYPLFLAAHIAVFGSPLPALLTQIILSLLIGYLILLISDRYFKIEYGIIACTLFFIMPFSLLVTVRYLTQVLFTAAVMLATWFWLEYLSKGFGKYLTLTALLLPLIALIRPIAILIFLPFIASLFFLWLFKKIPLRRFAFASIILVVVFIIAIAPWLWRNYEVFGKASLSSIPPYQLYFYDAPSIYGTAHNLSFSEAKEILNQRIASVTGYSIAERPDLFLQFSPITDTVLHEGVKVVLEDIPALIETRVTQFFKFFVRDGIRYWIERYGIDTAQGYGFMLVVAERVILGVLSIGFFFALLQALLRRDDVSIALFLIVLYFAALTGVMASAGLRYPAEPLFLLLGTIGLSGMYTFIRERLLKRA